MRKVFLLIAFLGSAVAFGQKVHFSQDSIVINDKPCLLYQRTGNNFTITSLDSVKLIEGNITSTAPGKFSTKYTFLTVNKEFSNEKINGRNALIFELVQNKILDESGALNEKKLLKFIKKYNQYE